MPIGLFLGYSFNGTSAYCQIPATAAIEPTTFISFEMRVKLNVVITSQPSTVATLGNKKSINGYGLQINRTSQILQFIIRIAGLNRTVSFDISAWNTRDLHHIAGVYDGSHIILYIDGAFVNQAAVTGSIEQDSAQCLNISASGTTCAVPTSSRFNGFVDEVRVWSTARTPTEISTNAYSELTGSESGLVGYWKFNETSGSVATDSTANANDGTLVNTTRLALNYTPSVDATFSAQNPNLVYDQTISPNASIATFSAQNPNLVYDQTISPNASIATFSAQGSTIEATIHPSPAVTTFSVPNATIIAGAVTIQASPALAVFTANSIKANLTMDLDSSVINFVVAAPTIRLTQQATPSVITLAIPPPTIVIGTVTIQPTPAIATFNTNGITANHVIYLTPAVAIFTLPIPIITFGQIISADPAIATFSISTPTVFVVRITISFGVKIFNEINYHVIIENS